MDFLDPKKRRANRIRLLIGYALVGIAISIATTILVYQAYGFGVDTSTGSIVQNGLVFVDSKPSGAEIYLNGQYKSRTGSRFVLPAGQYDIAVKRDGYRDWQRSFTLEGHSIERLVYPYLIPSTLTPRSLEVYGSPPTLVTQSPDRRWLLTLVPGRPAGEPAFDLLDTTRPDLPKTTFALPAGILNGAGRPGSTLKEVEWSTDNKHFLLVHTFENGSEYIVVNRETPASSFNVNNHFRINPSKVMLRDKKIDQLYILESDTALLRIGTTRERTAGPPLLGNVLAFKPHGADLITYITSDNVPAGTVQARIWEDGSTYQLLQLPASGTYLIDAARFDGHWYYVVGSDKEERLEIFKDPLDKLKNEALGKASPLLALRLSQSQQVGFSGNARFVSVQSGQKVRIYDIETDRTYGYEVPVPLSGLLRWMDGHRLIGISGTNLLMMDYDGINRHLVTESNLLAGGYFDRDYDRLYVTTPVVADGATSLRLIDMRSAEDQ